MQPEVIEEHVVLVDEAGAAIGSAPKSSVHDTETSLHLAFSCYVFNSAHEVLVTRRALTKRTWAGVWTNSFCGHPLPSEELSTAVERRAQHELGLEIRELEIALGSFRYRATDASGIVENEICPVLLARATEAPMPNPQEVCDYAWVSPARLSRAVHAAPWAFSPWMVLQMVELEVFGE